jgi:hypothetical protein
VRGRNSKSQGKQTKRGEIPKRRNAAAVFVCVLSFGFLGFFWNLGFGIWGLEFGVWNLGFCSLVAGHTPSHRRPQLVVNYIEKAE